MIVKIIDIIMIMLIMIITVIADNDSKYSPRSSPVTCASRSRDKCQHHSIIQQNSNGVRDSEIYLALARNLPLRVSSVQVPGGWGWERG